MILEEGVEGPNPFVKGQVEMVTTMADKVKGLTLLLGSLAALLCMVPELFLWLRSCCQDTS